MSVVVVEGVVEVVGAGVGALVGEVVALGSFTVTEANMVAQWLVHTYLNTPALLKV